MIITSKANPVIKYVCSLTEKKYRKLYGEYLVEGVKAVDECFKSGASVRTVVCTEELADRYSGCEVVTVSDELFERISTEKSPQGVLAVVKIPDTGVSAPQGSCLLLDRLQDPGNVGTIIRTANAAGYEDVYLCECADAFSPKAVRASMGGVFYVRLHVGGYDEIFKALEGCPVITADMDGENVFEFEPCKSFCLCIGNEGQGVSEIVASRSDYTVKVPMRDTCESLNAAVSAAIAMYALKNI